MDMQDIDEPAIRSAVCDGLAQGQADPEFELGWDYAHHGIAPPAERLAGGSSLERGYRAGRILFGERTPAPGRFVRKWLQLRLGALERGRTFDLDGVTPDYLETIDVPYCPILRRQLTHACQSPSDWSIDRVGNDGDYEAGNLAVMSTLANQAKRDYGFRDALQFMKQAEAVGAVNGLDAAQWARIAVLTSFVEPLDDIEAASLPMLVLPPPDIAQRNPLQVLQAQISLLIVRRDRSERLAALRAAIPGKALRGDFDAFHRCWHARVVGLGRARPGLPASWVLEDAWHCGLVLRRWRRFARRLGSLRALRVGRVLTPVVRT